MILRFKKGENKMNTQVMTAETEETILANIKEPYKRASLSYKSAPSVVQVGNIQIGDGHFAMIGGPCSIEGLDKLDEVAAAVKDSGANMLRGGAFKPRTSPYSFQGLGQEGLDMLEAVGKKYDLPVVTEVMAVDQVHLFDGIDMYQVGARNMQNFDLLKAIGQTTKPVLLKRGMAASIEDLLMAAEYILAHGNPNVILCERGIRTYETSTRNTLDLSAIPVLRSKTHLPIVVDPSHAVGKREWVESMAMAAVAAGADGLIIEIHQNPDEAWSDGRQSLYLDEYKALTEKVQALHAFLADLN
ncbi:3-deoxy-7-phosphoheptulonate synthase [Aerococcus viridans]|uniref:3-deoxy-7-phosphoheptulonate synthase n=2 Tax=Aerococcus viridans TaxID=1377 RepID=A0ABN0A6D8_AERVM|nr:3-deoxy-7-phosphoheptulonate synthase [Aerococcus viridans]EFG48763.1 3-deoxy-7-phosphoheptulonate synthase [Aerococcus viridans ATCC 11563 = CCUG 4311]